MIHSLLSEKRYFVFQMPDIPPLKIIYPFYHPMRPRFFNMATVFDDAIRNIDDGVKSYVEKVGTSIINGRDSLV